MEQKEIFYANLKVDNKGSICIIKEVVYKETDGFYRNIRVLKQYGIKEDKIKVVSFEIIKSMGYENITSESTSFTKSDEKRNNKTGAYD